MIEEHTVILVYWIFKSDTDRICGRKKGDIIFSTWRMLLKVWLSYVNDIKSILKDLWKIKNELDVSKSLDNEYI